MTGLDYLAALAAGSCIVAARVAGTVSAATRGGVATCAACASWAWAWAGSRATASHPAFGGHAGFLSRTTAGGSAALGALASGRAAAAGRAWCRVVLGAARGERKS